MKSGRQRTAPDRLPIRAGIFLTALISANSATAAAANENSYVGYDGLPTPVEQPDFSAEQQLLLELIVNGMSSGIVAQIVKRGDRFEARADDLHRAGLQLELPGETVLLDSLDGVHADYDALKQQLHLTVLPQYLPMQRLGERETVFTPARRGTGALLNYDLYASGGGSGPVQAALWHELRVFGQGGVFSTTGALRAGSGSGGSGRYDRYDTYWRLSDERRMLTAEAGDIITRTLPWAPAIRLGGVQLSRDFSVRPDIITYPLPEFAGSASLPSTVELILNGQRIAGSRIDPGPFALDTLPPLNGYGEANLVVTDIHGRSFATAMPFYVSSALLRSGLTDYSIAAGAIRRNYGISNFDYDGLAATASARHGVSDGVTVEARVEIADDLRLAGGGGVAKVGHLGTVSASYSLSQSERGRGGQLTLGYEYQRRNFTLGLHHSRQDEDYVDLGRLERRRDNGWEQLTSASASFSLGRAGTVGIGYFDARQEHRRDARLANASWTLPLGRATRLHASLSREFEDRGWSGLLTFSISLGRNSLSAGMIRNRDKGMDVRVDYSRPAPVEGGLGWSVGALGNLDQGPYLRGDAVWRTQPIELRAGAYGRDSATAWLGASGSFVMMDGAVLAANRVADAFAVVSTGESGIPVRYENQLIGRTDDAGRLLVPAVSAFYPARYDIETLSLPASVSAPVVSRKVTIAAGSGHVVRFQIERMQAARGTVVLDTGEAVPAGSLVTVNGTSTTYVGWNGLLFVENVAQDNLVEIDLPDGGSCRAAFTADIRSAAETETMIDLGVLTCSK